MWWIVWICFPSKTVGIPDFRKRITHFRRHVALFQKKVTYFGSQFDQFPTLIEKNHTKSTIPSWFFLFSPFLLPYIGMGPKIDPRPKPSTRKEKGGSLDRSRSIGKLRIMGLRWSGNQVSPSQPVECASIYRGLNRINRSFKIHLHSLLPSRG